MKHLAFIFTFLFFVLGLIISAPKAIAFDYGSDVPADVQSRLDDLASHYNLTVTEDWGFIYFQHATAQGTYNPCVCLFQSKNGRVNINDTRLNYSIDDVSSSKWYMSLITWQGDPPNYYNDYDATFYTSDTAFYGNFLETNVSIIGLGHSSYNQLSSLSTDFYNQSDVLLMDYNKSCGFDYSRVTAWFVNEQGRMTKIPISQTEPEGYTGLYCYPYEYSKFLTGFQVRLTSGENPLDYQLYWGQQLVVEFEDVNYTTLSLYGLQSNKKFAPDVVFYKNPSDRLPLDNSETTQGYFTIDDKNYIGTNTIVTEENNVTGNFYLVGNWWTEDLGVSDLLFGMSFTQTDSNGNVTDGKGTTNYNNTVNNYIQQAQMGMNGVDNGAGSFSADWSGQTVSATAPYNNNFEFSDNTGKSLFTALFSMGNGFILEAVLGVLGIAIAAYVLFGKS